MSEQQDDTTQQQPQAEAPTGKALSRDEIRAKIFSAKPQREAVQLFGTTVYLQEPLISTIMEIQGSTDKKLQFARTLEVVIYTEDGQPLFEEGDADALVSLPFTKEIGALQQKISAILGVTPTPEDKSSSTEE